MTINTKGLDPHQQMSTLASTKKKYDYEVKRLEVQRKSLPCFADGEDQVFFEIPSVLVQLNGQECWLYDGISCYQLIYGQEKRDYARRKFNDIIVQSLKVKIE